MYSKHTKQKEKKSPIKLNSTTTTWIKHKNFNKIIQEQKTLTENIIEHKKDHGSVKLNFSFGIPM